MSSYLTPPSSSLLASRSQIRNLPISFNNVSFHYPSRPDVPVLNLLSMQVKRGEHVAIVGNSGSGKSTMASLLSRLYDVNGGGVLVGSLESEGAVMKDVRDWDPQSLRCEIGVVSQEPTLFSCSIEDNIRFGRRDATDEEVMEAAEAANVVAFCANFPEGLKTLVGEKGIQLSGGQKQRVALARVFLKSPPIVILDEASSALDANSEFFVQEAIDRLMGDRTVISIAHRLSTIKRADRIVMLGGGGGGVVETGSFEELMKIEEGQFKALVKRQTIMGV
jgi:ABC-type multidrug transport system fused ATPase/permease subunit